MIVSIEFFKTVWKHLINKIIKLDDKIDKLIDEIPQSDWNTNDPKDPSYINNRICYANLTKETILPETEFTATRYDSNIEYYKEDDSNNIFNYEFYNTINNNEIVDVVYDGIAYENVSISKEEAYLGGGLYVTFASIGKFNDTPFCIQIPDSYTNSIIYFKTSGAHTISIVKVTGSYKKIDGNYLNLCRSYNEFSEDLHNRDKIVSNKLLTEYGDFIDRKYRNYNIDVFLDSYTNSLKCSITYNNIISYLNNGTDVFLEYLDQIYLLNARPSTYLSFINISRDNASDEYVIKSLEVSDRDGTMAVATEKESIRVSNKYVILNSSAEGSTKKFKITVDDTGTLSATEVT